MAWHVCVQGERFLTLELNFKNFMDRIEEKVDTILDIVQDIPNVYAKKEEVNALNKKIEKIELHDAGIKLARAKNRWPIIVSLVSATVAIVTLLTSK